MTITTVVIDVVVVTELRAAVVNELLAAVVNEMLASGCGGDFSLGSIGLTGRVEHQCIHHWVGEGGGKNRGSRGREGIRVFF